MKILRSIVAVVAKIVNRWRKKPEQSFEENVQVGLYVLGYYYNQMERLLAGAQANLASRIKQNVGLPLSTVNPIVVHEFPRYLRYSFISLLVSFLETRLEELCIEVGVGKGLSKKVVKDELGSQDKVNKSKKFLKDQLQEGYADPIREGFLKALDREYLPVLFLVRVRNCILHAGGDVSRVKSGLQPELRRGVGRWAGFTIENSLLVFGKEFCDAALARVRKLFSVLLTIT